MHANDNLVELTPIDVSGKKTGMIGNLSSVRDQQLKAPKSEVGKQKS
jgi:hypothetical protein